MYFELIIFTLQNYRHSPTYKTTQNSHFYVRETRKERKFLYESHELHESANRRTESTE